MSRRISLADIESAGLELAAGMASFRRACQILGAGERAKDSIVRALSQAAVVACCRLTPLEASRVLRVLKTTLMPDEYAGAQKEAAHE